MGIVNWLKDKVVLRLEHDVAMLNTKIEALEMQIETLKSQIATVRAMKRRKLQDDDEEESQTPDIDAIRKAFGGELPIEFNERMQRRQ